MSTKRTVCIAGPARGIMLRKKAEHYVSHGQARWLPDGQVEFIATDYRAIACSRSIERARHNYGVGFASIEQIAGLPCVAPIKLLTGKRPKEQPCDYPDALTISSTPRPLVSVVAAAPPTLRGWPLVSELSRIEKWPEGWA